MSIRLPIKLQSEPLVDAIFELRFKASASASDLLPGLLLMGLGQSPSSVERLPTADVPRPIREADANLKYLPIVQIDWGDYRVNVGDSSIALSCKLPYPGWTKFKSAILMLVDSVQQSQVVRFVERFALKYTNIVDGASILDQFRRVKLKIEIGGFAVEDAPISVRAEFMHGQVVHIVQVTTGVIGEIDTRGKVQGVLIDVDSIRNLDSIAFKDFYAGLSDQLESVKTANKTMVFSCISEDEIQRRGPVYE